MEVDLMTFICREKTQYLTATATCVVFVFSQQIQHALSMQNTSVCPSAPVF